MVKGWLRVMQWEEEKEGEVSGVWEVPMEGSHRRILSQCHVASHKSHMLHTGTNLRRVSLRAVFWYGTNIALLCNLIRPPLWSGAQSFWLQIQRPRVPSPALPDFLISSGSVTGSTQPRDYN
jgi:hypothetical protein